MSKILLVFFSHVRGVPERPQMNNLGIKKGVRMTLHIIYQSLHKKLWLGAAGADKYLVTTADILEDPFTARISPETARKKVLRFAKWLIEQAENELE